MKYNSKTELMFSSKFSWVELLELPEYSFIVIFIMTTVSLSGIPTLVDTVWDAARIIVNKFIKKEVFMSFIASFMRRIKYQSDLLDQLVTRYLARGISIRRGGEVKFFHFPWIQLFSFYQFPNGLKCLFFNKSKKRPDNRNIHSIPVWRYLRYLLTWGQFAKLNID